MHLPRGSVKLRFATGVIAFAITAGIAGVMPAQAAQLPARPTIAQAAPADCQTPAWDDGIIWVAVATCGGEATSMGAMTSYPIYGHFEFYGPHGFIANSPDGVYSPPNAAAIVSFGAQSAPVGSKWCARFWERVGNGYQLVDNNCVTL